MPIPNRLSSLFPINDNQGGTPVNGDMIPLNRNRLSGLFDVNNTPTETQPPVSDIPAMDNTGTTGQSQDDLVRLKARYDTLFPTEHENIDRYNQMVQNAPVRPKPGKMRQIFGGIAGAFLGPDARDAINYGTYNQDMADYGLKLRPAQDAANIERQNNANMRAVGGQILSSEDRDERLERSYARDRQLAADAAVRATQRDRGLDQADTRIANSAAQAAAKAKVDALRLQGGKPMKDERTGQWKMVYNENINGKQVPREEPLDIEALPAEERLRIQQDYALERIAASGLQARSTKATPGESTTIKTDTVDDPDNPGHKVIAQIHADGTYSIIRKRPEAAPTPGTTVQPVATPVKRGEESSATSELGKARALKAKVNDVRMRNPRWAKWISIDKSGNLNVTPANWTDGVLVGPSKAEYDAMVKALGTAPTNTPAKSTGETAPANAAPPAPTGWKYVKSPDGKKWVAVKDESK